MDPEQPTSLREELIPIIAYILVPLGVMLAISAVVGG